MKHWGRINMPPMLYLKLFFQQFCQFRTKWGKVAVAVFDGYFHQIQMVIKFIVVFNGKILIVISKGNLIQELREVADVVLLMGLKVGSNEDNALVGQSVTSITAFPETDVEANAIFADRHIEANLVSLKCNVIHTDAVILIEVHGNVEH